MKKLFFAVLMAAVVVGLSAPARGAEENIFFGNWIAPWGDGSTTIQVKDESSVPGTVVVVYWWGEGNGICTQARISDSTLVMEYNETIIVLRANSDGIVGERYSTTQLVRKE